jgi:hypothetical protein
METAARVEPTSAALDDVQQRVLDSLRSDGIALVAFDDLFADSALWDGVLADVAEFVRDVEGRLPELRAREDAKAYIVRRFHTSTPFRLDHPLLRVGLSSRVLDVINAYRGELTELVGLDDWYTIPDPQGDERVASQQWHRDPWDNHIVKVFTYLSDVDEEAGPFEYVRGSAAGGRYGDLWPWIDAVEQGVYPPQEELIAAVDPADVLTATGPAGTMIVCNTSGFHRGGWAKSRPRVLSYQTYVSPQAKVKKRFRVDWASAGDDLSPAARHAIGSPDD